VTPYNTPSEIDQSLITNKASILYVGYLLVVALRYDC
jgi:hypothetical protein